MIPSLLEGQIWMYKIDELYPLQMAHYTYLCGDFKQISVHVRFRIVLRYTLYFLLSTLVIQLQAQVDRDNEHQEKVNHDDADHDHDKQDGHTIDNDSHGNHDGDTSSCNPHHDDHAEFNPGATAFHHISDQNVYNIGWIQIPLPCILYVPGQGFDIFSSGKFNADYHGNGKYAYDGYVLYLGQVRRITDPSFPKGLVELKAHSVFTEVEVIDTKEHDKVYLCYEDKKILCDSKSTLDFGLFGGGLTSFHDLSMTKNVVTMLLIFLLLSWMFLSIARAYKKRDGMAPAGIQGFIEPIFEFIQEDVAKPFLGKSWEKFQPFLMALFFFILALNLFGQIPFLGGSNVTGNLSVTFVLALLAFIVTNLHGNKHYWGHIFNMPGIPGWVKVVVTPVEVMGLFIKPLTLMLRLFGNITAGHMVIVIFVGLIFIFGESGANPGAAWGSSIGSVLLTLFMMAIELLVAFIQAFVFAILTASYIGAAIEEHHDH